MIVRNELRNVSPNKPTIAVSVFYDKRKGYIAIVR